MPQKKNLHPELKNIASKNLQRLGHANPDYLIEVIVDTRGPGDSHVSGLEKRVEHTATIRQSMIDDYLGNADYVLWVDADVVSYPADLPTQLIRRGGGNVAAPFVLLDGWGKRFYDIAGFVENGIWFNLEPPYCRQPGPVYSLDGVGCLYLVPGDVYRGGAKHTPVRGFTDHLAVCRHAIKVGYKVLAFGDLLAYHADLPKYGEGEH